MAQCYLVEQKMLSTTVEQKDGLKNDSHANDDENVGVSWQDDNPSAAFL